MNQQHGYILLPVVILLTLVAAAAVTLDYESALDTGITASYLEVKQAEQAARAGLEHATWAVQNSGCIGNMAMTTVPFGQGSYTATVNAGGPVTASYSFTPDRDSWIKEASPDENNGGSSLLSVKNKVGDSFRALYHYDLSSIPNNKKVLTATAWFYVNLNDTRGPVTLHRLTADWTESDATWNTIGSNFESSVYGAIPPQPVPNVWIPVNITALAQAWVNDPATNYGILLNASVSDLETRFTSRESGASLRPYLQVTTADANVSRVNITATATLTGNPSPANDIKRKLKRKQFPAYQPPGATVLQLQPGFGKDAMLSDWYDTKNYGDYRLRVVSSTSSPRHSVIQFDLGALPVGARVMSAELQLYHTITETPGADAGVDVHRVSRDWVEGTQSGAGTADGATWLTWDGSNAWASAGGDYDPGPVANSSITDATGDWESWDVTTLAQGWLDGSFANNGLLLKGTGTVAVAFASKEDTDPTLHPKLNITYACECGSPCLAPQGSGTVLMVVVNPTTLVAIDAYKKTLFESWGYTVTMVGESTNQAGYDAAIAAADVVFISETVNAIQVGTKLQDAAIGVVSQDGKYNDALGIASGSAWTVASSINVTDTSHYITALFLSGPLEIYTEAMEQLTIAGSAAPDLQTLADSGGAGSLVVLDSAAVGTGGTPLAGRRVMLPLGRDAGMNWDYLNANGRLLVQRALQWGTGNIGVPPPKLLFVAASVSPTAEEQLRIDLIESWGYAVTLIDDDDSQANFDAAVADNEVVYVSSTVSDTTLGNKLRNAAIGVVNEQGQLVDEFGFGQQSVGYKTRNQIDVIDNTHYITEPFATGLLTIVSADQTLHFMTANEGPGFTALGQVFNTGSLWDDALGIIDSGGGLFGGGSAAGRRVLLPWGDASFDVASLNADGQAIMQRAIEWASAEPSGKLPVAHWKLDEISGIVAVDSAGGHDGELKNDPARMAGQLDGALDFDGNDDFVNVPHDDALSLISVMTLSAWVNASAYGSGYQTIVAKDAGSANSNYWFGTWQNELVFGFFASGTFHEVLTAGLNLQPGTWYHLAASFDDASGDVRLYVDGALVGSGTLAESPSAVGADLTLGRSPLGEYWHGLLDDVRLYDFVLAPGEIADLLSPGGGGSGPGIDPPPGNCDGTYRDAFEVYAFNNSDGSIDWSGNPWQEVGESDGPTAGDIQIWSDLGSTRIRTRDSDNGGEGLEREADLNGATTATLTYDYRRDGLDNSNDYTTVEVSANGAAGPWTELARYQGSATDSAYLQAAHDISGFIGSNTRIRFRTSANMGKQDRVWFDNIEILCAP